MSAADVEIVAQLDVLAFDAYCRQVGLDGQQSPRTCQNILACLNLNPKGCFVAGADEPVGYLFSRVWGALGWLGVFGLHPDCQGQGIGRALLRAGVNYLQSAGCKTIGLETMPDSPYNVGFYTRLGFQLWFPTLLLHKNVEQPTKTPPFALFSQQENDALSTLTQISRAAWPGLDYASEAESARQYGWGETLLIGWPQTWAFAVVRTVPKREGSDEPVAEVLALAIHPQARQRLAEVLQAVETFAVGQNAPQINLCVNGVDGQTLQRALDYGFRVSRVRLRMVYESEYVCPPGVDLSGWVM
jgi:ribosomal protein S18 acetylase RimI-like enzyme